ncbi:hypothetical protein AVEN_29131-1 [Araneus ventricosus]|uniref:Uncharacterized protein n=1 Tax=Araneus ventricosus TaxID=182803 RepID=A0A4Y2AJW5_ARAVE|nr:hypothetical protein AVEN_29131-1 [Araneus ventricosus]
MQEPYSRAEKIQGFPQSWTVFLSKTNKAAIAIVNKNLKPAIIASKKYTDPILTDVTPCGAIEISTQGENNLFVANSPEAPPTFERGIFKGWPDLTISTQDMIRAYRTTATSALQVILGIPPLYLQLKQEARVTAIRRLNISLPDTLTTLVPGDVEKGETGWAAHTSDCPTEE